MTAIPHLGFIVAAYAVTVLVLGVVVATILLDRRSLSRTLDRLDARAVRHDREPGA